MLAAGIGIMMLVVRAGAVVLGLVLAVLLVADAAEGAAPHRIEVGDVVLDHEHTVRLYPSLCSTVPAGDLSERPSLPVVVTWHRASGGGNEVEVWQGSFYPRHENDQAAVDIPDWVAYGPDGAAPRTCNRRLVSAEALQILDDEGVPVVAGDGEASWRRRLFLGLVLPAAAALVVLGRRLVSWRRRGIGRERRP